MISLSVIIPTYNPDAERFNKTLNGLKEQTLSFNHWELIVVDNNSSSGFSSQVDIAWQPNSNIVHEPKQGLTFARLKGFAEARGAIIVIVDDDNILAADYLEQVLHIFNKESKLGAVGGKSIPLFETAPPEWLSTFYSNLALRDLGDEVIMEGWSNKYPQSAPIGAGMALRKTALKTYMDKALVGKVKTTDRTALSLSSGGDNDMVIEVLKAGWLVAYHPALTLQHVIPAKRMETGYMAQLVNNTNRSWVQVLDSHGINPWNKIARWTVPLRKIKAWFTYKAWKNKVNFIRWQGACGTFEGLADSL
ncbi:glycosyltransferase [Mucilaginibacter pocheonensis]|uniref:Glycosyltransferase involved in cell wall biosynthesis n=1 Tax=Mucilaginibacter pocheonensis TaxID=398050 RepID=A0ABU1T4U0_9SPHI|nr:glycosyltransferase [Mucilaginibacter pocheonensis]MDR6940407.1 glycosyltransferase involved in cell wall biosynthesis [Mucilaginibacter pocheonensis]